MAKHRGKKYLEVAKLVDTTKLYEVKEALELIKKTRTAKFLETIEVALRLGVDPRHASQQIRGTVVLPHGTGKSVRILAITQGENINKALEAGADDIVEEEGEFQVLTDPSAFQGVLAALAEAGYKYEEAEITMIPENKVVINDVNVAKKVMLLYDSLDDLDDVQEVYSNFDIPDEIMEQLD